MNMKFALAAGVCAASLVGFSDVTSANVVGYMGKETTSVGNVLVAPMFDNVGNAKSFKLSDVKGGGYDPDEGAWGELCLNVLNSSGSEAKFEDGKYKDQKKKFYWFDNEEITAGWYDANGEVSWDADNIVFTSGDAFWIQGSAQTVTVAGQVGGEDVDVETPSVGNKATGNPFPVDMKLASIYCEGYDPDEGAWGELCINILNTSGSEAKFEDGKYKDQKKKFYWFDNEEVTAGWYDANGEVSWDANNIVFPAGQGMWIQGSAQSVHFPAPKLNN